MKTTPVSADLLIKLALGAAVIGVLYYAAKRATDGAAAVGGWVADAASSVGTALNPTSDQNIAYTGINAVGGAIVSDPQGPGKNADGSWTLGGFLYDITHPGVFDAVKAATAPTVPLPIESGGGHTDAYWKS